MIKYKLNLLNFIIGITMISMNLLSATEPANKDVPSLVLNAAGFSPA